MRGKLLRGFWVWSAAAIAVAGVVAVSPTRAGVLENFEGADHTGGYVPDPSNGTAVVLTPDNTMNSPTDAGGSWSLKITATTSGFHFGALRWDHGGNNAHLPQWQAPNQYLLYDIFVPAGGFTDFAAARWTFQSGAGQVNSGPPDTSFHNVVGAWQTLAWHYTDNGTPPASPADFWIEWLSLNSNGPMTLWIDNVRTVSAIPEPATAGALVILPVLGGLVRRRRGGAAPS